MNYKKLLKISFIASLALVFIFPLTSLAIGNAPSQDDRDAKKAELQDARNAKKDEIQEKRTEKTCEMLEKQAQQIQDRFTQKVATLAQNRTKTQTKIQERVKTRTNERTQRQASWEEKKELNWEKLEEKAETDKQKAAVAKFVETIQSAVKTKNEAINKIVTELRAEIQTQNNERKKSIDSQIADYQNSVASIVNQVSTDCSAGKDAKEIRENYRTQMKQARQQFQNRERKTEEFRASIKTLKNAKKAEAKTILETFKKTIEDAKTELRTAFSATTE